MVYVRVELWPKGNKEHAQLLGEGYITNIAGTNECANYDVTLMKSPKYAKHPGVWKNGVVTRFPRLRLGPWDLLFRALRATVGARNG